MWFQLCPDCRNVRILETHDTRYTPKGQAIRVVVSRSWYNSTLTQKKAMMRTAKTILHSPRAVCQCPPFVPLARFENWTED